MRIYSLSHVSDGVLLRELRTLVARDRAATARLLAHLAEVDARRLYLPAAYPSMFQYCVGELGYSESAARKRVHAARAARRFPAIFEAVADGRLHLSAVVVLAPHLTDETAGELLTAAEHKSLIELERLVAGRSPRLELPAHAVTRDLTPPVLEPSMERAARRVSLSAAKPADAPAASPERFPLRLSMDASTHAKLQYARELLSHQIPSGDMARVLDVALDALIERLEKRKFAATSKPRAKSAGTSASPNTRTIPAAVRREAWKRDGGQCTFVSETGRRCASKKFLEFDHVLEFALGGKATPDGIRLRCRAHNQFAAEQTFGASFMKHKRESARNAARSSGDTAERDSDAVRCRSNESDVVPWLRALGFSAVEARRGAAQCEPIAEAPLEERVRFAIRSLRPGLGGSRGASTSAPSTA